MNTTELPRVLRALVEDTSLAEVIYALVKVVLQLGREAVDAGIVTKAQKYSAIAERLEQVYKHALIEGV